MTLPWKLIDPAIAGMTWSSGAAVKLRWVKHRWKRPRPQARWARTGRQWPRWRPPVLARRW